MKAVYSEWIFFAFAIAFERKLTLTLLACENSMSNSRPNFNKLKHENAVAARWDILNVNRAMMATCLRLVIRA